MLFSQYGAFLIGFCSQKIGFFLYNTRIFWLTYTSGQGLDLELRISHESGSCYVWLSHIAYERIVAQRHASHHI